MERTEILKQIKDAELASNKKKTDCEAQCREIISRAEVEAKEILAAGESKRRKSREKALVSYREEIAEKKSGILAQGKKDAEALVGRTRGKLDTVVNHIITEFERAFDV